MSAVRKAFREPVRMLTMPPYVRTSARVFESRPTDEQWQALFDERVRANLARRGKHRVLRFEGEHVPAMLRRQAG